MPTEWERFVAHLKKVLPTRRPVVVRRCRLKDYGSTSINEAETRITISVRASDSLAVQKQTLIHEYAHALEDDGYTAHSEEWRRLEQRVQRVAERYQQAKRQ